MKRICILLSTAALATALLLAPAALAAETPEVTFDGSSHAFVITPEYDLFGLGAKGMMPGDVCTGRVVVNAVHTGNTKIYFSARPLPATAETTPPADAGDWLDLEVRLLSSSGAVEKTLYTGALSGVIGPKVPLGSFSGKVARQLEFVISVPMNLPNEYQNAISMVEWTFYAEQREPGGHSDPTPTPLPDIEEIQPTAQNIFWRASPHTGDSGAGICLTALAGMAAGGTTLWFLRRKKEK